MKKWAFIFFVFSIAVTLHKANSEIKKTRQSLTACELDKAEIERKNFRDFFSKECSCGGYVLISECQDLIEGARALGRMEP